MGAGQIDDVDVVADAGAVGRRIVVAEDAQAFAKAHHLPAAISAVLINVDRIYKLDAGPNAGDLIEG